jgi:hypothetical protein
MAEPAKLTTVGGDVEAILGTQICTPRALSTAGRGLPSSARACDVSTENR